jgi:hypothetical protein
VHNQNSETKLAQGRGLGRGGPSLESDVPDDDGHGVSDGEDRVALAPCDTLRDKKRLQSLWESGDPNWKVWE